MVFVGYTDAENAKQRFGGIKKELEGSKVEVIDDYKRAESFGLPIIKPMGP